MSWYPTTWSSANLFDICQPKQWKTISTKDLTHTGYTVYGANGEIGYYSNYTHEKPTLMITCRGATCGNLHTSKPFSYINGNAMSLDRLNESVCNQRYLRSYLEARGFEDVISGSAQPQITQEGLRKVEIPLAPLPEQKRIADKLDTVLARVDACRDRLDRLPALLKRFRQSILAAASSGQLTEDWREANAIDASWQESTIENLCEALFDGPFGSNLKSDDYTVSGVRVVRLENIGHLSFDASKETFISTEKYQSLAKNTLKPNDILFSSFVDEEVRVCLFPTVLPTAAINKADCFCLRVDVSKCLPTYLSFRLATKTTYVELKELVHGATRPRINLKHLRQYSLDVPVLAEQIEIVRRVEILFAFADRLDARLNTARKQVEQVTPALLAKAFRGELVPQDPADEPASELLRRLAVQRATTPKTGRGSKAAKV